MAHCVDKPLVYEPDTRVAWQDTHSPVFTYTYSAPFLDLPAKPTEFEFDNGHCCEHVSAVIRLFVTPATRKCASRWHGELPLCDSGCLF